MYCAQSLATAFAVQDESEVKVRVAIVAGPHIAVPPPQYGGSEQVIFHLIKGLKEFGHKPILIGTGDSKVDCPVIPIVDKAIGLPQTRAEVHLYRTREKEIALKTTEVLKSLRPNIDLIHSHGFDLEPFKDFPNITTLHTKFLLGNLPYFQERKDMPFISISQSQQTACPELRYLGVVYNGEDPAQFPLNTKPSDYVCFLGRFDRDKSPHLAIQLAIAFGTKIKLAGKIDHDSEGYFEQEIAKYFDHPLVEYLGELGFKDKVELLANARCNLHPIDFREPFGLTVIEAAYCGTPTLAVARGSMAELIEDGRTGKLVEDYVEGYHYLEECFAMDRTYIASRARQLFNYKTMTKGYLKAYRKVLAEYGVLSPADALSVTFPGTGKKLSRFPRFWAKRRHTKTH